MSTPPLIEETPATAASNKDVYGRLDQMVATLEQVMADRAGKRRSVNILKYRKIQTLKLACEDMRRLAQQSKELTELNPPCRDRYERMLDDMARRIFADCQLE